jgi:hypothetical protein
MEGATLAVVHMGTRKACPSTIFRSIEITESSSRYYCVDYDYDYAHEHGKGDVRYVIS